MPGIVPSGLDTNNMPSANKPLAKPPVPTVGQNTGGGLPPAKPPVPSIGGSMGIGTGNTGLQLQPSNPAKGMTGMGAMTAPPIPPPKALASAMAPVQPVQPAPGPNDANKPAATPSKASPRLASVLSFAKFGNYRDIYVYED